MTKHSREENRSGKKISEADLVAELRRLANDLGRAPKTKELDNGLGKYHSCTYGRRFGSWENALSEAGIPHTNTGPAVSDEALLKELQRLAAELGETPTFRDMANEGGHSPKTYHRRFGSWNRALEKAGLTPNVKNPSCDEDAVWRDSEVLRGFYHEEGLSGEDISERLGVSPSTVYRWMDSHGIERVKGTPTGESHWNYGPTVEELKDGEWLKKKHHDEALPFRAIADELGCGPHAVSRAIAYHDIEKNPDAYVTYEELKSEVWLREMYVEKELSCTEIAERIGCSAHAVSCRLKKYDIKIRPMSEAVGTGPDHPNWNGGAISYYGPSWYEQREKCLERDGRRCVVCGMTSEEHKTAYRGDLHVHHITPFRKYGVENHERANRLDNLVTLCHPHHDEWEGVGLRPHTQVSGSGSNA